MHNHEQGRSLFFYDLFSLRGRHISALGRVHPGELALGSDSLWVIRQAGSKDEPILCIEGVELTTGQRLGPGILQTADMQTLGDPISHRRWSEVYGSVPHLSGLNWQGEQPWLTIQFLRPGTRPVRKRCQLSLEAAIAHLSERHS